MGMSVGRLAIATLAALLVSSARPALADPAAGADAAEAAILAELNFARTHPQEYARRLLLQPVSDWEAAVRDGGDTEDPGAYAEAVEFLLRQSPLPPLSADAGLEAAAQEHVATQGPDGTIGHEGPAGERFDARLRRHGVTGDWMAENIAYGPQRPSDVVRELIIDRGVASRGHRRNIFSPALQAAGARCGPHKTYDTMCVIDFASLPRQTRGWRQAALAPASDRTPSY